MNKQEDSFSFIGLYYEKGVNKLKAHSKGIVKTTLTKNGVLKDDFHTQWDGEILDQINSTIEKRKHHLTVDDISFHALGSDSNGNIFISAEGAKRSDAGFTRIKSPRIFIIELTPDLKLKKINFLNDFVNTKTEGRNGSYEFKFHVSNKDKSVNGFSYVRLAKSKKSS